MEKSPGFSGAMGPILHSHDYVVLQLTYDAWTGLPAGVKTSGWNRGFNFALMYDFPIQHSHFSFAPGLGISTSGMYFRNNTLNVADSTSSTLSFQSGNPYKKYKLATAYIEIPLELRYRQVEDNANTGFKVSLGVKFGMLLDSHSKGKKLVLGDWEIDKIQDKRAFNNYRVAATARIGYGNIALFGSYTITNVFKPGSGLNVNAYSIGLCLSGM